MDNRATLLVSLSLSLGSQNLSSLTVPTTQAQVEQAHGAG